MSWEDLYFERNLEQKDIIKALAHVFEVEEDEIVLSYGGIDWQQVDDEHTAIHCSFDIIRGAFPINVEIGVWTGWKKDLPQDSERYAILGRLCDLLKSPALATGDHSNLYIRTLIRGEGNYQYVQLDKHKMHQPDGLIELEINDYLYNFSHQLSKLEVELGILITRKKLDKSHLHKHMAGYIKNMRRDDVIRVLNKVYPEAKRMYREDLIQEIIDSLEQS